MEITYKPIEQQDVEKIFADLKELILRYEDLGQIDCEKVLAWSRRRFSGSRPSAAQFFCDSRQEPFRSRSAPDLLSAE